MPRFLRRFLDHQLTRPGGRRGIYLLFAAMLSVVVIAAWDLRERILPGTQKKRQELASLNTLEADLIGLRAQTGPGNDLAQRAAWEGVFSGWTELAAWLERSRSLADGAQSDIEWIVREVEVQDPRFPALRAVEVEWTLSPSEPSYRQGVLLVRELVQDRVHRVSLQALSVEGDELGVKSFRIRVRAWMRGDHG